MTNEDRLDLEEAKKASACIFLACEEEVAESLKRIMDQLIHEVERLRELECCDVFMKHHGGKGLVESALEDMENEKKIDSLTKERDELSNRVDHLTKTGYEDVTKMGRILDDVRKIKKLESENAELKETLVGIINSRDTWKKSHQELKQKLAEAEEYKRQWEFLKSEGII